MQIIKMSQCQNVTKNGKVIYTLLILLIFRESLCQYILHFVTYPSLVCTACPCQMLLISPSIFISSSLWWCCLTFQVSSRCPCCLCNAKTGFPSETWVASWNELTNEHINFILMTFHFADMGLVEVLNVVDRHPSSGLRRNLLGNWVILIFSGQKPCTKII